MKTDLRPPSENLLGKEKKMRISDRYLNFQLKNVTETKSKQVRIFVRYTIEKK